MMSGASSRTVYPLAVFVALAALLSGRHVVAQQPSSNCTSNRISGLNVPDPSFCNYYDVLMDVGPTYDLDPEHLGFSWLMNAWVVGKFGDANDHVVMGGQIVNSRLNDVSGWVKERIRVLSYAGSNRFTDAPDFFATGTDTAQFLCSSMTSGDYLGDGRLGFACSNEGIDTYPFPGEPSQVFVPSASGYVSAHVDSVPDNSQGHGAASGVIDDSGRTSIFFAVIGGPSGGKPVTPYLLINQGNGDFTYNTSRLPRDLTELWPSGTYLTRVFTAAALIDTTGVGRADLVVGTSHSDPMYPRYDSKGNTVAFHSSVYMNPGKGDFSAASKIDLPAGCFGEASEVIAIASADLDQNKIPYLLLEEAEVNPSGGSYKGNCLQILKRENNTYVDVTTQLVPGSLDRTAKADHRIKVLDINGDGFLDIVVQSLSDGSQATYDGAVRYTASYVLLNDGNNRFKVLNDSFLPGFPVYNEALIPIDLEHDGHISFLAPYDVFIDGGRYRKFALYRWRADMPVQ